MIGLPAERPLWCSPRCYYCGTRTRGQMMGRRRHAPTREVLPTCERCSAAIMDGRAILGAALDRATSE